MGRASTSSGRINQITKLFSEPLFRSGQTHAKSSLCPGGLVDNTIVLGVSGSSGRVGLQSFGRIKRAEAVTEVTKK